MSRKYKSIEELTIRDNFMFVKVFSDEEIAKPFLRALLKIEIERVNIVGEAHLQSDPSKKYIRFDVMVKEDSVDSIGRVFDLEMQMVDTKELPLRSRYYQGICDTETLGSTHKYSELREQYIVFLCSEDVFGRGLPIYEFENREKSDSSLTLGDHTYKFFCNFSKYEAVTDESVRDYLKYFATGEATSVATQAIQDKVDFYHKDPKTRSDYMTFKDMLEDEREEGRLEGAKAKAQEMAKKLKDDGIAVESIAKYSGLSVEEILAL